MTKANFSLPVFRAPFAPPDEDLAAEFLASGRRDSAAEERIDARVRALVGAIRVFWLNS